MQCRLISTCRVFSVVTAVHPLVNNTHATCSHLGYTRLLRRANTWCVGAAHVHDGPGHGYLDKNVAEKSSGAAPTPGAVGSAAGGRAEVLASKKLHRRLWEPHVNGVALYSLRDERFAGYVRLAKRSWPPTVGVVVVHVEIDRLTH